MRLFDLPRAFWIARFARAFCIALLVRAFDLPRAVWNARFARAFGIPRSALAFYTLMSSRGHAQNNRELKQTRRQRKRERHLKM